MRLRRWRGRHCEWSSWGGDAMDTWKALRARMGSAMALGGLSMGLGCSALWGGRIVLALRVVLWICCYST